MPFYWTINEVPACEAEETDALGDRYMDQVVEHSQHGGPPVHSGNFLTKCQHESRESAQNDASKVLALFPEAKIEIIEGQCPNTVARSRP